MLRRAFNAWIASLPFWKPAPVGQPGITFSQLWKMENAGEKIDPSTPLLWGEEGIPRCQCVFCKKLQKYADSCGGLTVGGYREFYRIYGE